jgi:predicted phage tail protein/predicted  nucleic acid-binding Zn-ribbon protein
MSVLLVKIPSPLNPDINHKEHVDYVVGQSLAFYVDSRIPRIDPNIEWVVAVNGLVVSKKYTDVPVKDNDKIAICPKTEFTAAAAVASGVVSTFTTVASFSSLAALASYSLGAAALYAGTFLATSFVIGYGMSMLASALAPDMPSFTSPDTAVDPTYGWDVLRPTDNEGTPVPYVYGTNRVAGHVINRFVLPEGDNTEKLHVLIAVCDDEVDAISDILINDQPASYFDGCDTGSRPGTLSDAIIPGFDELVTQNDVGAKVSYASPRTQQTQGVCEKLRIILTAPYGLYRTNDEGGLSSRTVNYTIEYRPVGGDWSTHITQDWTETTTSGIKRALVIDDLPQAQYEVRVTRNTEDSDSFRERTDIYFDSLQEVVKESLTYPGLAKYFVKITATDQLSGGMPAMSCLVTKSTVRVFNPNTGLWEDRAANNPAWICYDLLMKARVPKERVLYDEFSEWADHCTDEALACNTVVSSGNFWDQVQRIARIGRAAVLRRNTFYGAFVDKVVIGGSHHLFTMGNIVEDSFNIQYLPQKDRATAVELEYTDPDRDHTRQIVTVYSSEYVDGETDRKASVSFQAALPRDQVIREGVFRINSNRYLVRVVTLDAFVDSFACTVGDVFDFKHEILDFTDAAAGGRVVAASNDLPEGPCVTLDRPVHLAAVNTYKIKVRLADDSFAEKTVDNTRITDFDLPLTTLPLTMPWSDVPQKDDLYAFGEAGTYTKQYRITSVTRKDENIRTIVGLEYIPEIYTDGDEYVIEEPPWETDRQQAVHVMLNEFISFASDGSYRSNLNVSWHKAVHVSPGNWAVWLEDITAGSLPVKIGTSVDTNFIIAAGLVTGHTYQVFITGNGEGMVDTGTNSATITILGKEAPPGNVLNLTATYNPLSHAVVLLWSHVSDIDLDRYEVRQTPTELSDGVFDGMTAEEIAAEVEAAWDAGTAIVLGSTEHNAFAAPITGRVEAYRYYMVKAVDETGNKSEAAAWVDVAVSTSSTNLTPVTGLSLDTDIVMGPGGYHTATITAGWDDASLQETFKQYVIHLEDKVTGIFTKHYSDINTYQWHVTPNQNYGVAVAVEDLSGNLTTFCDQVIITAASDAQAPAAPTGLNASVYFSTVNLTWQHSNETDLAVFNVYRSDDDVFANGQVVAASMSGITSTTAYALDTPPTYDEYHYWVTAVDTSGNESDPDGPVAAMAISAAIGEATIGESLLTETLRSRIDLIDTEDTGLVAQVGDINQTLIDMDAILNTAEAGVLDRLAALESYDLSVLVPFNSGQTYSIDDLVSYGGSIYACIQDITSTPAPAPTNTAYWKDIGEVDSLILDDISANAAAISALDIRVTSAEGTITSQSSDITQLESDVSAIETTVNGHTTSISGNASAISALDTRVTSAEGTITSQASDITQLESDVSAIETTVNGHTTSISGNASAISALDTRVTSAEGTITSQSSDITQLESDVNSLTTTVNGHTTSISGNASAISGLNTRVTAAEGTITSQSSDITQLESDVSAIETTVNGHTTSISGNASAISALDTRVTSAEGTITSQASDITQLQTTVGSHTTSIETNATSIDGVLGKYSVKVDNNGYVSGFGLISEANDGTVVSEFAVVADHFKIASSTNPWVSGTYYYTGDMVTYNDVLYTSILNHVAYPSRAPGNTTYWEPVADDPLIPFVVSTIDGKAQVGINGELLVDGSILTHALAAGAVKADHIDVNSLHAVSASILGHINLGVNGAFTMAKTGLTDNSAGVFIGYNAANNKHVFAAGDSGNYIKWNGTGVEVAGSITITAGTGFQNLSDKPTALGAINSTEGSKLAGIAENADVTSQNTAQDVAYVNGVAAATVRANAAAGATFTSASAGSLAYLSQITNTYLTDNCVEARNINVTNLNAMKANTGNLTVDGTLTFVNEQGNIRAGKQYLSDTSPGVFLGARGSGYPGQYVLHVGDSSKWMKFSTAGLEVGGDLIATGNIVNNAVTVPVSAYSAGSVATTDQTTWHDVQTATIVTSGGTVEITFSTFALYAYKIKIYRGTTLIYDASDWWCEGQGERFPVCISLSDTPAAGSTTYKISGSQYWNNGSFTHRSLRLLELKR